MNAKRLKLRIENNWEFLSFHVGDKELTTIKQVVVQVSGKKGKRFKVFKTDRYSKYSDMGRESSVTTVDFQIPLKNELGIIDRVSLFDLSENKKVKIYVDLKDIAFKKEEI